MSDEEYDKNKVGLNFKCIISPESQEIDLKILTESFIERLEKQTGYKLCWKACIHSDTEHRHSHVVINGKDQNGEEVFFNKETIELMRLMCSNAATQMIGERTKEQIKLTKKKFVEAKSNFEEILRAAGRYNTYLEEYAKNPEEPLELYTGGGVKGKVEKIITFDKDEAWNDALIVRQADGKRVYVPVWQLRKENLQGKNITIRKSCNETKIARQVSDKNIIVRE